MSNNAHFDYMMEVPGTFWGDYATRQRQLDNWHNQQPNYGTPSTTYTASSAPAAGHHGGTHTAPRPAAPRQPLPGEELMDEIGDTLFEWLGGWIDMVPTRAWWCLAGAAGLVGALWLWSIWGTLLAVALGLAAAALPWLCVHAARLGLCILWYAFGWTCIISWVLLMFALKLCAVVAGVVIAGWLCLTILRFFFG